ncbi:MAG TPA: LysM peptidoglycan-binding domain-containing protein [Acidimicrobiia bacterium]|nr:LysM peptidoglycan-binding domain-containing protein [Acidimicrobiia bacterium]
MLISVTAMMVLVLVLASGVAARDPRPASVTVVVAAGDTLWDLASAATPPGRDVRATVFEIRKRNHLTDSVLRPGQVVRVPAVP